MNVESLKLSMKLGRIKIEEAGEKVQLRTVFPLLAEQKAQGRVPYPLRFKQLSNIRETSSAGTTVVLCLLYFRPGLKTRPSVTCKQSFR